MTKHKSGTITLVGAGPGDPRYLTVGAAAVLEDADVVVYDYLANPEFLRYCRDDAETIYVGKQAGNHTMSQDEINKLLVTKAAAGNSVVRLKGGDPFLFGRGLEEIHYISNHDIPCTALPGIPAAVALSSAAGIPLTDRHVNTTLHIVTGHTNSNTSSPAVRWDLLAHTEGVIVIYMGIGNLRKNMHSLLQAGYDPATRAAVVQNISLPDQRTVTGTAETIADTVEDAGIESPALVILGETVGLAPESMTHPQGICRKRILITRESSQAGALADFFRRKGAFPEIIPLIRIEPADEYTALDDAIAHIQTFTWILFTSPNGVSCFFERLFAGGYDARTLAGVQCAAIGTGTARRLQEYGITADFIPGTFTSSALVTGMAARYSLSNAKILLPRSDIAPPALVKNLEKEGATVVSCTAYKTVPDTSAAEKMRKRMSQSLPDMITFTSSSTVDNFADAVGETLLEQKKSDVRAASIGPETTARLRHYGITPALEAAEHSITGLADAVCRYYRERI